MSTPTRPIVRTSSGWTAGDRAPDGRVMVRPLDRRPVRGRRVHRRGGDRRWRAVVAERTPDQPPAGDGPDRWGDSGAARDAAIEACNPAMNGMSTVCPDVLTNAYVNWYCHSYLQVSSPSGGDLVTSPVGPIPIDRSSPVPLYFQLAQY